MMLDQKFASQITEAYRETVRRSRSSEAFMKRLRTVRRLLKQFPPVPDVGAQLLVIAQGCPTTWKAVSRSPFVVGRAAGCDLVLQDGRTSNRHLQLEADGQDWWINDLDSTNGVLVNGVKCTSRMLSSGDVIQAGKCSFVFLG